MKIKLLMFAATSALCLAAMDSSAQTRTDHPSLCTDLQREWGILSTNGRAADIQTFRDSVDANKVAMCPVTIGAADSRVRELEAQEIADAARRDAWRAQQGNAAAAQLLREANAEATRQRQRADRAAAEAAAERAARLAREQAEAIPGRPRNLLACSLSQDIARFDRGNIPGTQIENLVVPPEIQVVYDLVGVDQGVIDVYSWDLDQRQWSRSRAAVVREGNRVTIGGTSENEQNARIRVVDSVDLDAMTVTGQGYFEPINAGGQSAIDINRNGQANLNLGALMQRAPRLWLESRGTCAFQSGGPPGPLTATPSWRVTDRAIPTIPPLPRGR